MYETYWNLAEKPFQNNTNSRYFFYGETYEEAYIRLLYSVAENKGLMLLTGKGGIGKTFLCKNFFRQMLEQGYKAAFIANPNLEPIEFMQQLVHEFGLDYRGKSKFELRKELQNFILENAQNGSSTVIIIDEAQLIYNDKTLEEICLLLNLESGNRQPLTIILCGKSELGQLVRKNAFLQERIGLQYNLQALNCQATGEYIWHRLNKAGCSRDIVTTEAVKEVYAISGGIPRQINYICDLALLLGYGDSSIVVDAALVKKAADDLRGK